MSTTPTDRDDQLDWSRERDGRMRDAAAADDAVPTRPYDPDQDDD